MQLQFTELGGESEPMPAMAPFAMRTDGVVYNRGTTRGSGVLESTSTNEVARQHTQAPQPAAPPPSPPAAQCAPPTQCATPTPCAACPAAIQSVHGVQNGGLPPWLMYALLLANVMTIVMCLALVTRRR
jgi:hypothetical protein